MIGRSGSSPQRARAARWAGGAAGVVVVLFVTSSLVHLAIPAGGGPYAVGRRVVTWTDPGRPEEHTDDVLDRRTVPVTIWYPARAGSGEPVEYVADLSRISDGLVESGELSRVEVLALAAVRDPALDQATPAAANEPFPVLVMSPGNLTNVGFYSALAEGLASQGYVVFGVDHPFQVAAVALPDSVAVYAGSEGPAPDRRIEVQIEERVADIEAVIGRLLVGDPQVGFLGPMLDLERIGVLGHSNGGLAAVETCRRDRRVVACVNIDGQNEGGPFGYRVEDRPPDQPFLFLTKEAELHPELNDRFETAGSGAVRVVVPDAAHGDFTDGALFEPGIDPFPGRANAVVSITRQFLGRFFDEWLRGETGQRFSGLEVGLDVHVNVYPLGDSPPIPS